MFHVHHHFKEKNKDIFVLHEEVELNYLGLIVARRHSA